MKLISFSHQNQPSWGVLNQHGIVDLGRRTMPDLGQLLTQSDRDSFSRNTEELMRQAGNDADFSLDQISYLPPIPRPGKIICIGVNYAHRHKEYRDNPDAPRYPSVFMRTPESLVGHLQPLQRPIESEQLDYEGEIVLVIGQTAHRLNRHEAIDCVLGYTLMNEGSVRDWIRHGKFNVTQGKNFFASGSLGPYITTADQLATDAWRDLRVQTRVNDALRQDDPTAHLMFPFDSIISYLSIFMTLRPGDIIATGTPNGSGARLDPPQYLQAGDRVEVSVEQLGTLSNKVVDAIGDSIAWQ